MKTRSLRLHAIGLALAVGTGTGAFAADNHEDSRTGAAPPATATTVSSVPAQSPNPPALNPLPAPQVAAHKNQAQPALSVWSTQILKLVQGGLAEDVVFSYLDSAGTFNLTADQIITLTQLGVQRDVIAAMIQHDADIVAGVRQVPASTVPSTGAEHLFIPPPPPGSKDSTIARNREPAPSDQELPPLAYYAPDFILGPLDDLYEAPETHERSPVRKPYAVKLTDPILVWPASGRMPNTTVLEMFP